MIPRYVEPVTELKELGLILQESDNQLAKEQKQIEEEYFRKNQEVKDVLKNNPDNALLKIRKEEIEENYKQSFNELLQKNKSKEQEVEKEIYNLMINQDQTEKFVEFKREFSYVLNELDRQLNERAVSLNQDLESNVLHEFQKIDVLVFNTVNALAKKDVLVNIDQAKVALIIRLRTFTDYDLEHAQTIANGIIDQVAASYMENKRVSFEKIAKDLEERLKLPKGHFVEILSAVKGPCAEYLRNKEYLYTNLYNAKKLEFQQRLRGEFYDKLIDQDQARIQIEQQMLAHLIKAKNPKDFYLTFVRLGMEEIEAVKQKDEKSIIAFKRHQLETLNQLRDELNEGFLKFYQEKEMTLPAIKMLNISEVQKMYMRIAILGFVPPIKDIPEHYSLTTQAVLKALDEQEQKMHGNLFVKSDSSASSSPAPAPTPKLDLYKTKIQKERLHQFKMLVRFESDSNILKELQKEIEVDPSKKLFLDALNHRLQQLANPQSTLRKYMLMKSKTSPSASVVADPKRVLMKV